MKLKIPFIIAIKTVKYLRDKSDKSCIRPIHRKLNIIEKNKRRLECKRDILWPRRTGL